MVSINHYYIVTLNVNRENCLVNRPYVVFITRFPIFSSIENNIISNLLDCHVFNTLFTIVFAYCFFEHVYEYKLTYIQL